MFLTNIFKTRWSHQNIQKVFNDVQNNFETWETSYERAFYIRKGNVQITFDTTHLYFLINNTHVRLSTKEETKFRNLILNKIEDLLRSSKLFETISLESE